jgi:hydrogenase expression/formation protein HypC
MCIALPMRVIEAGGDFALVEGMGERRRCSLLLIGPQPLGTPLLIHGDTALRVLDEAETPLIESAIEGLRAVQEGRSPDAYFEDLINRVPELPAHLRGASE